jgi:hypothetical protein
LAFRNSAQAVETSTQVEVVYGRPLLRTLESQLSTAGVTVYPEDRVKVFPDPSFGIGSKITIERAPAFILNDAGTETTYRSWTTTIKELFSEKGIEIGVDDKVSPSLETPLLAGGTITITRVVETDIVESQPIAFKTVTKSSGDVYVCATKIEQEGKNGVKELTFHVRRENGEEVSRKFIGSKVASTPTDKIILNGSKLPPAYESGGATWYEWKGGMYAAHKTLPFGTKVYVRSGSGKGVCVTINDRGPWLAGRIIDLQKVAFSQLASPSSGVISVTIYVVP